MSQVLKDGHNPRYHHVFITRRRLADAARLLVRLSLNTYCYPAVDMHAAGRRHAYLLSAKIVGRLIREVLP